MKMFNDNQADLDKYGFLSLGNSGIPAGYLLNSDGTETDKAHDATDKYALGDVFVPIPLQLITSTTDPAVTRIGAGSYKKTLVASTTHNVLISLPAQLLRTFTGSVGVTPTPASNSHGVKVRSIALSYRVNTNDLTSITLKVYTLSLAAAASVPTATEQTSTIAGATVTQAANQYLAIATVTTPTWISTLDNEYIGEAVIITPGSCTCDLLGAVARVSVALY